MNFFNKIEIKRAKKLLKQNLANNSLKIPFTRSISQKHDVKVSKNILSQKIETKQETNKSTTNTLDIVVEENALEVEDTKTQTYELVLLQSDNKKISGGQTDASQINERKSRQVGSFSYQLPVEIQESNEKEEIERVIMKEDKFDEIRQENILKQFQINPKSYEFQIASIICLQASLKCYKCKQRGHIAKVCPSSSKNECICCLGKHFGSCLHKVCNRCGQDGHAFWKCKARENKIVLKCKGCGKVGHRQQNCGAIVKKAKSSLKRKDSKVKCLKCKKKGHANCHAYVPVIPNVYQQLEMD